MLSSTVTWVTVEMVRATRFNCKVNKAKKKIYHNQHQSNPSFLLQLISLKLGSYGHN